MVSDTFRIRNGSSAWQASGMAWRFGLTLATVLALLFGVPWWTLFVAGTSWPPAVSVLGALAFLGCLAALHEPGHWLLGSSVSDLRAK
jgi:hypothetical protein